MKVLRVKRSTRHPKYDQVASNYDVAVLEVDRFRFTPFIKPVCLPGFATDFDELDTYAGDLVSLTGWGAGIRGLGPSNVLKRTHIGIFAQSYCNASYDIQTGTIASRIRKSLPRLFTPDLLCAGYELGGIGSCSGDSGGPLVKYDTSDPLHPKYIQIAIVQGAVNECGDKNFPGIYIRVGNRDILEFIRTSVGGEKCYYSIYTSCPYRKA